MVVPAIDVYLLSSEYVITPDSIPMIAYNAMCPSSSKSNVIPDVFLLSFTLNVGSDALASSLRFTLSNSIIEPINAFFNPIVNTSLEIMIFPTAASRIA